MRPDALRTLHALLHFLREDGVVVGDFVVVINASQVKLKGRKLDQKLYHRYSGYPGGLTSIAARDVRQDDPERMITQAVKGMLPKNRLSRAIIKKLKVYGGEEHPHSAQQPQPRARP